MLIRPLVLTGAALAACLAFTLPATAGPAGKRIVDRASAAAEAAEGVTGNTVLKAVRRAKSRELTRGSLRLTVRGLDPRTRYRLLMDDPTDARGSALLVLDARKSTRRGRLSMRFGSRKHPLPFGADPADLAGARYELRSDDGVTVATGRLPALERDGPKLLHIDGEEHGCAFRDVVVVDDGFGRDTAGAAPAGWTVSGTDATAGRTILVDGTVDDGSDGQSVRVTDTDSTTTAGPAMVRTFAAQTGRMAAEFTLIPADTASRIVAQLGSFDGTTFTAAGAFAPGVGLHEDGQVGFGGAGDFGSYEAGTPVTFRIDVDVAGDTFDLTIDGVVVSTGVTLGLGSAGLTSVDAVNFTSGDSVTGTANVDTVRVVDVVDDCAPTANAGLDITVECAGERTPVALDGTGSSDPEDSALTYAWTGRFEETPASGVTPTVNFTALGTFDVSLVVNDGIQDSAADTMQVTVEDTTPPRIAAPADITLECTGPGTALRLGMPTVLDLCDPDPVVTNDALRAFRVGETTVTWTATDASGNAASDEQLVTITDTTDPTIQVGGLPATLWPPNHKLVRIRPRIAARDLCDPDPRVTVRIASNEDDDSQTGDGSTTGDIVIHSAYDIELRAERKGNGSGRTYTLVWTVTDASGNTASTRPMTITVPHSQGNGNSGNNGKSNGNGNGKSKGKKNK